MLILPNAFDIIQNDPANRTKAAPIIIISVGEPPIALTAAPIAAKPSPNSTPAAASVAAPFNMSPAPLPNDFNPAANCFKKAFIPPPAAGFTLLDFSDRSFALSLVLPAASRALLVAPKSLGILSLGILFSLNLISKVPSFLSFDDKSLALSFPISANLSFAAVLAFSPPNTALAFNQSICAFSFTQ